MKETSRKQMSLTVRVCAALAAVSISAAFTVAPEVVYVPTLSLPSTTLLVTKICARVVPGMAHSAVDAAKPARINRIFIGVPRRLF